MNIMKTMKKVQNMLKKSSIWFKLVILSLIVLVIANFVKNNEPKVEGFEQKKKFVTKDNNNLFDDFYCEVYNELIFDPNKNNYEVTELDKIADIDSKSKILDVGCGLGHHVDYYREKGVNIQGLDKSESMVKLAKKRYPKAKFKKGDVLSSMIYRPETFTHVLTLYFTIYYMEQKSLYFKNVYDWLRPGGMLVLHLVNRNLFDPILQTADPLLIVSPQKFAKKRITNSVVKFENFTYKANFDLPKNSANASFIETFTDDSTRHVRRNEHKLYMEKQKDILKMARSVGFMMKGRIDLVNCAYEYQYLYLLQKPD
jgi:2-polyprenyl-3-methyl-5-hydroxy-6-metoxy-1,4-benzoquinol methylase